MRTFHIDFSNTDNQLPDGNTIGFFGEHNATILSITPPAEMAESEEIICYRIAFGLTNYRTVTSEPLDKTETVSFPLNAQITRSDTVSVQLIGYDAENNLVMKSETVKKLKFSESVGGTEIPADGSSYNLGAEVAEIKKRVDKLEERPTESIICSDTEIIAYPYHEHYLPLISWEEILPVGTEIKTIKIKYNGAWIDIHELNIIDAIPYVLTMNKVYVDEFDSGAYVFALLGYCGVCGTVAEAFANQNINEVEVVYYTDGGAK